MAQVRLWINPRENAVYDLPHVCMVCGADATNAKIKEFQWYPPWTILLILLFVWPFLIVALVLSKRMRVEMQFCDRHKYHYVHRTLLDVAALFVLIGMGFLAFVVAGNSNPGNQGNELVGLLCGGWLVVLVVVGIALGVFNQRSTIRPTKITDRDITLTNVSPEFVRAVEEEEAALERDIDREVRERWREDRRRERRVDDDRYQRRGDLPPPERRSDRPEAESD
jgi:hypothetical protein